MGKFMRSLCLVALCVSTVGCAYFPGGTNLKTVAEEYSMTNITTGDGNFGSYQAIGYYTGTELGIAIGIPYVGKIMELYPPAPLVTNEKLLGRIAKEASDAGANAMINVTPHREFYTGFPFFFIGIYVDQTMGTGIRTR